jgi:hypothetical protein
MRSRGIALVAALATVGATSVALAAPVPVPNGGFEEGSFENWETFERGGGDWGLYGVLRQGPGPKVPPPPEGNFGALLTQGAPGLNILHRVVKLEPGADKIRFELYYDNSGNPFVSPKHFRFGGGEGPLARRGGAPNQQLRVDLMKPKAKIKALRDKDVLATLLRTRPGDPKVRPYEPLRANLKRLGIKAKRVRLRIAEVDNVGNFTVAVDDLRHNAG